MKKCALINGMGDRAQTGKSGITYQPISSSDPLDELDYEVDVCDLSEVLGRQVESVTKELQTVPIDTIPLVEVVFSFNFYHFICHSACLASHIRRSIRRDGCQPCEVAIFHLETLKNQSCKFLAFCSGNFLKDEDLLGNLIIKPKRATQERKLSLPNCAVSRSSEK